MRTWNQESFFVRPFAKFLRNPSILSESFPLTKSDSPSLDLLFPPSIHQPKKESKFNSI